MKDRLKRLLRASTLRDRFIPNSLDIPSIKELFDEEFYLSSYPEVRAEKSSPFDHYLKKGHREGKNPNSLLDSLWYRTTYDQQMDYSNPLFDFVMDGWRKRRNPNPLFDVDYYLTTNPDVRESGMNPLLHYLRYGAQEGRWANSLFDSSYYLKMYPEVARAGLNPLHHFLASGAKEGRNPSAKFDVKYYLASHPEVAATGVNPLVHHFTHHTTVESARAPFNLGPTQKGGNMQTHNEPSQSTEGPDHFGNRLVQELFDEDFYLSHYPGVVPLGGAPLEHYLKKGFREGKNPNALLHSQWYLETHGLQMRHADPLTDFALGGWKKSRNPNPLFDIDYYLNTYVDVRSSGINPLFHYLKFGANEGRRPNPYFDSHFYLRTQADVAQACLNPLYHFLASGAHEGRNPSDRFDVKYYMTTYPDVAAAGLNPLVHYIELGAAEGRMPAKPSQEPVQARGYIPPEHLLPWFAPLNLEIDPLLANTPFLNVLVPGLGMKHMSGGPNTALNLAGRLAAAGVPVRFCSTNAPIDTDTEPFWAHVCRLADLPAKPANAQLVDMSNRFARSLIGKNDLFMATAWWTAQMAKYAIKLTNKKTFVYLIQDYEPLLHAASTPSALAEESYGLDHIGVINTELLHEFLVEEKIGRYADEAFASTALVFNPAVDRTLFYPANRPAASKRQLLFYARPTNGLRNLFEIGVAALQKCIFEGVFDPEMWDFIGMGEAFADVDLGSGCFLRAAPWQGLDGYAAQMRDSDLLLSLMLSPHPSYPPLEMALCDRKVVTNVYFNKSAARLAAFSPNIIGIQPTIEGVSDGIRKALGHRTDTPGLKTSANDFPATWGDAFADVVPRLTARLLEAFGAPGAAIGEMPGRKWSPLTWERAVGFRAWPKNAYEVLKYRRQAERSAHYIAGEPDQLSFLTTVWDTPPEFLEELAESVFTQDCGTHFEWVILDNGSSRADTRAAMTRIASHPCVRLSRVEKNLGIIGGMRHVLGIAKNRYVIPLDSDDLLTPDCVRILSHYLKENNYPALAYTDEDKILDGAYRDPYDKPDWDPVLFFNSCYIAHLGCIDREKALRLGAYQDDEVTGCHDYDTFTRFYLAGYEPMHIPEIVYTWRMHQGSTAGNISSKDYISNSQKKLLRKFLDARAPDFSVEPSPLFNDTPDWRLVRPRVAPRSMATVWFGAGKRRSSEKTLGLEAISIELPPAASVQDLANALAKVEDGTLIHLRSRECLIADSEWPWEAMGQMDLFPDTVMIGGVVYVQDRVVAAPGHFGFGRGCESPDIGRSLTDPGYFAQMLKQHSVACVPIEHAVIKAEFLRSALRQIGNASLLMSELGPWLGAIARTNGKRIVYSPFMRAEATAERDTEIGDGSWLAFRTVFAALLEDAALLSRSLSRRSGNAYLPISPSERDSERFDLPLFNLAYAERARSERLTRQFGRSTEAQAGAATVGLMTSVYIKTDPEYLRQLIDSVRVQTSCVNEWIILENGPIPEAVADVLRAGKAELPIKQYSVANNLGIQGAMAYCLDKAEAEFVSPLDADDLLEPDAIECIREAIGKTDADLLFSDEDHIIDDALQAPFRRAGFDPILNAVDSYVWHLVVYRRTKAIRLGLYSEPGAEFCHDWDSITRFWNSGSKIHHVPAVLYHWRMHRASTSGSGELNEGTRRSVEWMLKEQISRQAAPDLYEVGLFPLDRGVPQLSIQRKLVSPLPICAIFIDTGSMASRIALSSEVGAILKEEVVVAESLEGGGVLSARILKAVSNLSDEIGHVLFIAANMKLPNAAGLFEAMRLFEMHPEVGAVGGRVLDLNGRVIDIGKSLFRNEAGNTFEWNGLKRNNPDAFALALKPQLTQSISHNLFFARRDVIVSALSGREADSLAAVAELINERCSRHEYFCAFSPLIEASLR